MPIGMDLWMVFPSLEQVREADALYNSGNTTVANGPTGVVVGNGSTGIPTVGGSPVGGGGGSNDNPGSTIGIWQVYPHSPDVSVPRGGSRSPLLSRPSNTSPVIHPAISRPGGSADATVPVDTTGGGGELPLIPDTNANAPSGKDPTTSGNDPSNGGGSPPSGKHVPTTPRIPIQVDPVHQRKTMSCGYFAVIVCLLVAAAGTLIYVMDQGFTLFWPSSSPDSDSRRPRHDRRRHVNRNRNRTNDKDDTHLDSV